MSAMVSSTDASYVLPTCACATPTPVASVSIPASVVAVSAATNFLMRFLSSAPSCVVMHQERQWRHARFRPCAPGLSGSLQASRRS